MGKHYTLRSGCNQPMNIGFKHITLFILFNFFTFVLSEEFSSCDGTRPNAPCFSMNLVEPCQAVQLFLFGSNFKSIYSLFLSK